MGGIMRREVGRSRGKVAVRYREEVKPGSERTQVTKEDEK
jgi:hypothetical protein